MKRTLILMTTVLVGAFAASWVNAQGQSWAGPTGRGGKS